MSLLLAALSLIVPADGCAPAPRLDDASEVTGQRPVDASGSGLWIAGVRFRGEDIVRAAADQDAGAVGWSVDLMLTQSGREKFAAIQRCRAAQIAEISFNRVAVSRPTLSEPIDGNVIRIAGNFSESAAADLAARIRRMR